MPGTFTPLQRTMPHTVCRAPARACMSLRRRVSGAQGAQVTFRPRASALAASSLDSASTVGNQEDITSVDAASTVKIETAALPVGKEVVLAWYDAVNSRKLVCAFDLLEIDAVLEDYSFESAFTGKAAIMKFLSDTAKEFPTELEVVIDQMSDGSRSFAVKTHWKFFENDLPMTRTLSFFELNASGTKIAKITESPEAVTKVGEPLMLALVAALNGTKMAKENIPKDLKNLLPGEIRQWLD